MSEKDADRHVCWNGNTKVTDDLEGSVQWNGGNKSQRKGESFVVKKQRN